MRCRSMMELRLLTACLIILPSTFAQSVLTTIMPKSSIKKFKGIEQSFKKGEEEYIAVSDKAVDMLSTTRKDYTLCCLQALSIKVRLTK